MKLFSLFNNATVNVRGNLTTGIFIGITFTLIMGIAIATWLFIY